ncbi:hypothetical protein L3X38_045048 [Prunus dulcis]|uniref:Uncharacterized protein n=1 Tax=Prunus dulcis TaxID=3755 RepID=A0AAD4V1X1_PRUDU|nr:hypothetical protein L3X38_045048 [Prunus dulcis]
MSADPEGHLYFSFEAELCDATPEVFDRSPPKPERTISDRHDEQTSAHLVMPGPGGKATSSGKRAIELHGPQESRDDQDIPAPLGGQGANSSSKTSTQVQGAQEEGQGDNQNLESESVEDDNFLIPLNMIRVEDASGGTSEEKAAPKVKAQAAAPATRRKRKRREDPKTYVPLAFREKKCQEYYFYEYA